MGVVGNRAEWASFLGLRRLAFGRTADP